MVPSELVYSGKGFLQACVGLNPPRGIWCHIAGIDLVRISDGHYYVLEDNMRCPSGVAYVLEARQVMKRTFPELFEAYRVRPVDGYPSQPLETLRYLSDLPDPTVVILTPGIYNSAYYEHSLLAQKMGVELVEANDLVVVDGFVHMRTTKGSQRVDVIYRRINDEYLDPLAFRPDSVLGVPGLMESYKKGRVALAMHPAPAYRTIRRSMPTSPRSSTITWRRSPSYTTCPLMSALKNETGPTYWNILDQLVVKATNEAGGYGMMIGPHASKQERRRLRPSHRGRPAQLYRSTHPCALKSAHSGGRSFGRASCRSAPVRIVWPGYLCVAGRHDPGGVAERVIGRQFVPRRRK